MSYWVSMSLRYEVNTANKIVRYTTLIQYAVISRKSLRFQSAFFPFPSIIPSLLDAYGPLRRLRVARWRTREHGLYALRVGSPRIQCTSTAAAEHEQLTPVPQVPLRRPAAQVGTLRVGWPSPAP